LIFNKKCYCHFSIGTTLTIGVLTDFEKYLFTFDFRNSKFNFLKIFYWPSEGLKSLKSFISAYRARINKRALICDHRKFVYFGRIGLLWKILIGTFGTFGTFGIWNFNFLRIFFLTYKRLAKLKSQFAGFLYV